MAAVPNLVLMVRDPNYLSKFELLMQHPLYINHCPTNTNPDSRDDKEEKDKKRGF